MEVVGPSRRTLAIAYRALYWPAGEMLTSLIAYYFQDWNWFQIVASIPPFLAAALTLL